MPNKTPDLDASVVLADRQQSTSNESQRSHDGGLVAMLWLLAALVAEIEFWMLAFAHMYRM